MTAGFCLYVNSLRSFRLLIGDYLLKHNKADRAFEWYAKVARKSITENNPDISVPYLTNYLDTIIQKLKIILDHSAGGKIDKTDIVEIEKLLSRLKPIRGNLGFDYEKANFLASVYAKVGKYYKDQSEPEFSQKAYNEAISYHPKFLIKSNFTEDLIPVYTSQEKWEEILEVFPFIGASEFSKITGLQEGYFFYYLGKLSLNKNDLKETVGFFKKAYEVGIGDAAFQLGKLFERQGNLQEGACWFSRALRLVPTHIDSIDNLIQTPDHLRPIEITKKELMNRKKLLSPINMKRIDLGGKVEFLGYQISSKEGKTEFRFWFKCLDKMTPNYMLSLHGYVKDKTILEPDRVKYGFANWGHIIRKVTSKWDIGEVYVHDYEKRIPEGEYNLAIWFAVAGKYLGDYHRIGWVELGS